MSRTARFPAYAIAPTGRYVRDTSRLRVLNHPARGAVHYEHHRLAPADHPDLHLVIYTPVADAST